VGQAFQPAVSLSIPWRTAFAYSTDLANLLTGQLTKFTTLNRHQLAGQVANLDFWLAEARHCLEVLDSYPLRFERLQAAQTEYVQQHNTIEFSLDDPCCTKSTAAKPIRIRDEDRSGPRRELCDAVYRLLLRCYRERLIDEPRLLQACKFLDISVESGDLQLR
jgi:hypothetical protein